MQGFYNVTTKIREELEKDEFCKTVTYGDIFNVDLKKVSNEMRRKAKATLQKKQKLTLTLPDTLPVHPLKVKTVQLVMRQT